MINTSTFKRILRNAVFVPLLGLGLMVFVLLLQLGSLLNASYWTDHTYQVISEVRKIDGLVLEAQDAQQDQLLSNDTYFGTVYEQKKQDFARETTALGKLVEDNKDQVAKIPSIRESFRLWTVVAEQERQHYESGQNIRLEALDGNTRVRAVRDRLNEFLATEMGLLKLRTLAAQQSASATRNLVLGLTLVLGTLIGLYIHRQLFSLATTYGDALSSLQQQTDTLQHQADTLRANAEEIQRLNTTLEQRVEDRTAQLQATNKELEAFSYSVSHDLRAPLRSIDGFSQALLEDYGEVVDAEGKKYLDRIRSNSQHMAGLIDSLLNLSRLTRAEMKHERVELSALARDLAAQIQQREPQRPVTFRIADVAPIEGDEKLLRVALENLLGNAFKFTAKTPDPVVEFGANRHNEETIYFVRDNGAGFDMAYADKLFGAFQRLHSVGEFEGTGIGLATVQRVIHRHGGRIWAEGAVGKGATFYFTLRG